MDDAISREQAIKATWQDTGYTDPFNVMTAIRDRIKQLPPIQTEPHWIPCSERLPDMHDEVLVTARGEVSIAWLYVDGKWRSNDMPQPMFKDIIAWMPLPEPYKGVTE